VVVVWWVCGGCVVGVGVCGGYVVGMRGCGGYIPVKQVIYVDVYGYGGGWMWKCVVMVC